MSLQTIIANSEYISINDHRLIGQTLSRNKKITTSEIVTAVPFEFTFKPNSYMSLVKNKTMLNNLRVADRNKEQTINLGNTGWKNITAYQGNIPSTCTINMTGYSGSTFNWTIPVIASNAIYSVFKAGDFVQWGRYAYMITEDVIVTVPLGTATISGTAKTHRPIMDTLATANNIAYGNTGFCSVSGTTYTGVTFPVILREYPTYTLRPCKDDSFIDWNGDFRAIEYIL